MTQFARPDSDIAVGLWLPTPLWMEIDEVAPDDAVTEIVTVADVDRFEVGLSNVADPIAHTAHQLKFRARQQFSGPDPGNDIFVELLQGAAVIKSALFVMGGLAYTTFTFTLTLAEAALITDYTDLRVSGRTSIVFGNNADIRVTWVEFAVPDEGVRKSEDVSYEHRQNLNVVVVPRYELTTFVTKAEGVSYEHCNPYGLRGQQTVAFTTRTQQFPPCDGGENG